MTTQASIDSEIESRLLSGSNITALTLRGVLHDMNASSFQSIPPPTVPLGSILNAASSSVYSWTTTPSLGVNGAVGGSLQLFGTTSGNVTLTPTTAGSTLNILQASAGTMLSITGPGASIANQISIVAAISGAAPKIAATGADTNVNLTLGAQGGSGAITFLNPMSAISATFTNGLQMGIPTGGDLGAGTINTQGTIYVNSAPIEAAQRINGTVGVAATTDFTLTIPPNASVIGLTAFTTVAFTCSGTALNLTAGSAVGDTAYVSAQNIKSLDVVKLLLNGTNAQAQSALPATSPNYWIRFTQTGTSTNVGAATVLVHYVLT